MDKKSMNNNFNLFVLALVLLFFCGFTAHARTSCKSMYNIPTVIGLDYVTSDCVREGVSTATFLVYAVRCTGNTDRDYVEQYANYGDTYGNPAALANYMASQGYRAFINSDGTHIVAVHPNYTGLIDGKRMSDYPAGSVYTGVFEEGFLLGDATPPACTGGDLAVSEMKATCEKSEECSLVNMGTGRLSNEQKLFSTSSGQPLSLDLSLYYNTQPSIITNSVAPGKIGNGWTHSYEMSLANGSNAGEIVFWNRGERKTYTWNGSEYQSPKGDYSTLTYDPNNSVTPFFITEKSGLKRNFNAAGQLLFLEDRNGNELVFTYTNNLLTKVTDPNGREVNFAYTGTVLTGITDPGGRTYGLAYTSSNLSKVSLPDGKATEYAYGSNKLLSTRKDAAGNETAYTYDSQKRVTRVTDPLNDTINYTYPTRTIGKMPAAYPAWGAAMRASFTQKENTADGWTYVYNPATGVIISKTDPLGNTTSYTYDDRKNMLSVTEPGIGTTRFTYDAKGNVLGMTDPTERETLFTYNSLGQVLTIRGAPGSYTFIYDAKGNLTVMEDPLGATVQYAYDAKGNLTSVTDERNKVTSLTYDAANNLTSVTAPTGAVTRFTHDASGNLLTYTDALNRVTKFSHDTRNRLISIEDPAGNTTSYAYDGNGNPILVADANSNETEFGRNYRGQATSIQDALANFTNFSYGAMELLTLVSDAKSQQTRYTYDASGRVLKEIDALNLETVWAYGATANPDSVTLADNTVISFTYDAVQRLTGRTGPAFSESFTYDAKDNLLTAENANISYEYTYDAANRLVRAEDSRGYVITYAYDAAGNRTSMVLQPNTAGERTFSYTYDNGGRLSRMATPAGTFGFTYDLLDRRTALSFPNNMTANYTYHATTGFLGGIDYENGDLSLSWPLYDNVGNILQKGTGSSALTYSYDDTYQVLSAGSLDTYTYDSVGNRVSGPGATPLNTYAHNAANQMTQGINGQYTYDAKGNRIRNYNRPSDTHEWLYTWSADNLLLQAQKIDGNETVLASVTFTYDPFGRRISKTVQAGLLTRTTRYVYDGSDIVLQYDTTANFTTETLYVHGPGVDEHLAVVRNNNTLFFQTDLLGSTVALTDASRNAVKTYQYDSYGKILAVTAPDLENIYAFAGREWDEELGLYFYRARYYDPVEGRFLSRDPIGFEAGDVNWYRYVGNNPVNWVDPWGLFVSSVDAYCTRNPKDCALMISIGVLSTRESVPFFKRPFLREAQYEEKNMCDEENFIAFEMSKGGKEKGRNWITERVKVEAKEANMDPCDYLEKLLDDAKRENNRKLQADIIRAEKYFNCRNKNKRKNHF